MLNSLILGKFVEHLNQSISHFAPEIALVVTLLLALFFDVIFKKSKNISGYVSLVGFAVTAVLLYQQFWLKNMLFAGAVAVDPYAVFFKYIILISSTIVVILSFLSDELYKGG